MAKAIYAFSGDPITYGHVDIIRRATSAFDKVIVGIGAHPTKQYMFSLEERTEMARRALANFPNIEVVSFKGLLVDFAYEHGIPIVVRGIRNAADLEYENSFHEVGASQKLGIDTHLLFAKPELAHISSSNVKAIQKEQGLIHEYVPLYVKQYLEAKMSGQYIVGITGEIGSGKSYISRKFEELGRVKNITVYNIELDHIGHKILTELKEPRYAQIRKEIIDLFGRSVGLPDGTINRKALGDIVFDNPKLLDNLNKIMYTPLLVRLRRELYGKKGLILFNAALIAESDMTYLCNNNVVLVNVDKESQQRRLAERNLSNEQIQRRLDSQFSFEQKKKRLEAIIERDKQGKLWILNNSDSATGQEIPAVFNEVIKDLNVM
jgi:pantetheine-phosphate adenylyltransferase